MHSSSSKRTFLVTAMMVMAAAMVPVQLMADSAPDAEVQRIESLLAAVGDLKGAKFIRNGSEYDAKSAVKFLRGKWQAHAGDIHTAAEFIAKAASVSSTTGKPHVIRFQDGKETPCGDYLTEQLKHL